MHRERDCLSYNFHSEEVKFLPAQGTWYFGVGAKAQQLRVAKGFCVTRDSSKTSVMWRVIEAKLVA